MASAYFLLDTGRPMPSIVHEVLVELFTETQALADLLYAAHGLQVAPLSQVDPNLSDIKPVELRADGLLLTGDPRSPKSWLLLEVQTSIDKEKLRTIPKGLEMAQDRHRDLRGDVVLVSASDEVARYYDEHPFRYLGPLGTDRSLKVVRVDLSRLSPERLLERPLLGLPAVAAHRVGPQAASVARQAFEAATKQGGELSAWVVDAILQMVEAKVAEELRENMLRHGYRTDFLKKAFAEGEATGEAKGRVEEARAALMRVLKKRAFALSPEMRRRIKAEGDLKRLERWHDAAVTAATPAQVFADA